jgi:hypothetical protein
MEITTKKPPKGGFYIKKAKKNEREKDRSVRENRLGGRREMQRRTAEQHSRIVKMQSIERGHRLFRRKEKTKASSDRNAFPFEKIIDSMMKIW